MQQGDIPNIFFQEAGLNLLFLQWTKTPSHKIVIEGEDEFSEIGSLKTILLFSIDESTLKSDF